MPVVAAFTLPDGQATPVSHTFSPSGPDKNGVHYFYDRSGGFPIGFPSVSVDLKEPKPGGPGAQSTANRVYRGTMKIVVPVMEVSTSASTTTGIPPAPTKSYDVIARMEFVIPERSSLQSRKDALSYAQNLLVSSIATALVRDLESFYG